MKFLILSDIHALSREMMMLEGAYSGASGGTHIAEDRDKIGNRILAISDVHDIRADPIDAILVLGDLAHQAKQLVMTQVWSDIHQLATELSIENVFGVVGNHDIYSRASSFQEAEDLRNFLKTLNPKFPTKNENANTQYFADGISSCEVAGCHIILLNTCDLHGIGSDASSVKKMFSIGNVSTRMLELLREIINQSDASHFVIVLHHHPKKIDLPVDRDTDAMLRGELLLQEIENIGKPAFVIHGHKHLVSVSNWKGREELPLIFSASSLAAHAYPGQERFFSNQFHLIEIDTECVDRPKGKIFSWDWAEPSWQQSDRPHMPFEKPFGFKVDFSEIAQKLKGLESRPKWSQSELFAEIPELSGYSSNDISELNDILRESPKSLAINRGKLYLYYEEEV